MKRMLPAMLAKFIHLQFFLFSRFAFINKIIVFFANTALDFF
jgi:hypothetical protein